MKNNVGLQIDYIMEKVGFMTKKEFKKNLRINFERKKVLDAFRGDIFPIRIINIDNYEDHEETLVPQTPSTFPLLKLTCGMAIKILSPKQMLQRLITALAQAPAGNTSKSLINDIQHEISKWDTKWDIDHNKSQKEYTTIWLNQCQYKDVENSNTSDPYRLVCNLANKMDLW